MTKTATALSSKTGFDYVVRPIQSGISSGVGHVSSSVGHMSSVAGSVTSHVMSMPSGMRRRGGSVPDSTMHSGTIRHGSIESHENENCLSRSESRFVSSVATHSRLDSSMVGSDFVSANSGYEVDSKRLESSGEGRPKDLGGDPHVSVDTDVGDHDMEQSNYLLSKAEKIDPALVFPEQNIDIQGPSTGKKLTDDLDEIKDKMHELTWHLFDDHTYVIKNPNAVFFGESKKPEKWRKSDPSKQLNKYLHMGQYSHSNPFVSRVGKCTSFRLPQELFRFEIWRNAYYLTMHFLLLLYHFTGLYVEPIIGSSYSILCLFRAGFNVVTWRDPMLTFWLSFSCGIIAIILFVFPWREFLLIVGILAVGPQNWIIRILREQGHLPPAPEYASKIGQESSDGGSKFDDVPVDQPVFSKDSRKPGNDPRTRTDPTIDPREIHHVVVPYGPLCHQRCNDWPPEPEYAQVKRDTSFDDARQSIAGAYQIRRNVSLTCEQSSAMGPSDANRIGRLRRRLRRGGPNASGQGLPPLDPSRNRTATGDSTKSNGAT
jgi:hypothetical protein